MANKGILKSDTVETETTPSTTPANKWLSAAVLSVRVIVGIAFIFSGAVKLIDPTGTALKIEDYLAMMNLQVFSSLSMPLSVLLSMTEFVLGTNALLGSYCRTTPRLLLVLMGVMTPLTLYLAIANPISDCGCFGDAIHLTNWQTFIKNVILLLLLWVMYKYNHRVRWVFHRELHSLIVCWSVLFGSILAYVGIDMHPLIDFRPYKIGTDLSEAIEGVSFEELTFDFIYEKAGVRERFSLDNIPNEADGWKFVERIAHSPIEGKSNVSPLEHFVVYDGNDDVTEEILSHDGYVFIMFSPDVTKASDKYIHKLHELYEYCEAFDYPFYAVVASTPIEIEAWVNETGCEFDFMYMDRTTIQTIARNNPFVLVLKNGIIYHKYSINQLPDDALLNVPFEQIKRYGEPDNYDESIIIWSLILLYFIPILILYLTERIALFLLRKVRKYYKERRKKNSEE